MLNILKGPRERMIVYLLQFNEYRYLNKGESKGDIFSTKDGYRWIPIFDQSKMKLYLLHRDGYRYFRKVCYYVP